MKKLAIMLIFLILVPLLSFAEGQRISRLEFRDKPIADILLALGEAGGVSIVPDATIGGNASYYFSDMDFSQALSKFAGAFNLYASQKDGVYYLSKVDARYDDTAGLASLNAEDVRLIILLRAFSKSIGKTILHDDLPDRAVSIHADRMSPEAILGILSKSVPGFSLEVTDTYFFLHRMEATKSAASAAVPKSPSLSKSGELFSLEPGRISFLEVVGNLFNYAGKDYSILMKNDTVIDGLRFKGRSFEEALGLILEQANADFSVVGDIWYLFEIQRKDVLKKLKATLTIPVEHLAVSDISGLLPPDFVSSGMLRLDKPSNSIYLSGSLEEIKPVQDFISQIDVPPSGRNYLRFDLKHLKAKEILGALPPRFSSLAPVVLPDGSGFVLLVSEKTAEELRAYLEIVDRKTASTPITLKFIKSEELLKNLPPSAAKENLVEAGNGSIVFFLGSEEKRRAFLEDLAFIDRPKTQIRYDVLIVQYNLQENASVADSFNVSKAGPSDVSPFSVVAGLTNLLNLNFNIVSNFGYLFALNLNAGLGDDRAQVFADTTLYGTVGKEVKFQNTTTYRYLEFSVDPDTGKLKSTGATREVSSGLILVLNSWASGDGMVTTDISATFSDKLSGDSGSGGTDAAAPPTTSERIVSTNVHTPSGVPIVLGGLRLRKSETIVTKLPVIGSIPLLGKLFERRNEKASDSELVIYLIPYVTVDPVADGSHRFALERLYSSYVKGY